MAIVTFASDTNPQMQQAKTQARATFRYFWRELAWERRRIIPGLDLSAVKVAFRDPPGKGASDRVEEMWVGDVDFDGKVISGTLLNEPNWLQSIAEGDPVEVPLEGISDWMYALQGRVYGGHTINLLRTQMQKAERDNHDQAWGFEFGNPYHVKVLPDAYAQDGAEHPMALNMGMAMAEHLKKNPQEVAAQDERGFTLLHDLALAGAASAVSIALAHGADASARTKNGFTSKELAQLLGWKEVVEVLARS